MKAWEKWHEISDLFLNPERVRMFAAKCPECGKPAHMVQIRAERPPYVIRCKKLHLWTAAGGVAVRYVPPDKSSEEE